MAKKIMQFRYYGDNANKNYPQLGDPTYRTRLVTGSLFSNYTPITQLGIQTLPGTKFYINDAKTPIIIGSTGIYELNLEGISEIINLKFENGSINTIANNPNAYLIVDIIYSDKEGN